ncbi:hypothetical protein ACFWHR_04035 [Leucobacter sp. NPDC058333]|uniref:hypothetical protein n=1 Tax=Leucobacter sp. NPDC058333 TaxID=3346450 RepID=UPI00365C0814
MPERRLSVVVVGDPVRVDDGADTWRVDARDPKTGMLTLESLRSMTRMRWEGVHEFRVQRAGMFS